MELIVGKEYNLKYSGEFCHAVGKDGFVDFKKGVFIFIGTISVKAGKRNIFYDNSYSDTNTNYVMFDAKNVERYIVSEMNSEIYNKIETLEKELAELKQLIK